MRERVRGKRVFFFLSPGRRKKKRKRGVLTGLAAHSDFELHARKGGSIIHRQGCRERGERQNAVNVCFGKHQGKNDNQCSKRQKKKKKKGQNDSQDFDPTVRGKKKEEMK